MPYKDKKRHSEYTGERVQKRRREFFENKCCKQCGSEDSLQIHHRDPLQKVSHRVFSWSMKRFEAEVAKCDVLCALCHNAYHGSQRRTTEHGLTKYRQGCRCDVCKEARRLRGKIDREQAKRGAG